jgi:hypothetical protein
MKSVCTYSLAIAMLSLGLGLTSLQAGDPCKHGSKCTDCTSSAAYQRHASAEHWSSVRKAVSRLGEIIREKENADADIVEAVKQLEELVKEEESKAQPDPKAKSKDMHKGITHWNYEPIKDKKQESK